MNVTYKIAMTLSSILHDHMCMSGDSYIHAHEQLRNRAHIHRFACTCPSRLCAYIFVDDRLHFQHFGVIAVVHSSCCP